MVFFRIFLIVEILVNCAWAQLPSDYYITDKKASEIPDSLTQNSDNIANYVRSNFNSDANKLRANYYLTAHLIDYDINLLNSNYIARSKEENIAYVLTYKKGVCQHYAELFADLCLKTGIKAIVIDGYTKQEDSKHYVAHAWCIVFIDNSWKLFDPTWSAGYINNGEYIKHFTEKYYAIEPTELVKTHLPFDPLFELLSYPLTRDDFESNLFSRKPKSIKFNYSDSIAVFEKLSELNKLKGAYRRTKNNGSLNALTTKRLNYLKQEIESNQQNELALKFNQAVDQFNSGINAFNRFVAYRNDAFIPIRSDSEIKAMLDSSELQFRQSMLILTTLDADDRATQESITQLIRTIHESFAEIDRQNDFLKRYFKCDVTTRETMF